MPSALPAVSRRRVLLGDGGTGAARRNRRRVRQATAAAGPRRPHGAARHGAQPTAGWPATPPPQPIPRSRPALTAVVVRAVQTRRSAVRRDRPDDRRAADDVVDRPRRPASSRRQRRPATRTSIAALRAVRGQRRPDGCGQLSGYRAGLLGSIAASCTAAYTVALGAMTSVEPRPARLGHPTPTSPRSSTPSPTEHAVIYGYGLVSAHSTPDVNDLVAASMAEHRERREAAIAMLTGRGVDAAAARRRLSVPIAASTTRPTRRSSRCAWRRTPRWRGGRCSSRRPPTQERGFAVHGVDADAPSTAARWSEVLGVAPITVRLPRRHRVALARELPRRSRRPRRRPAISRASPVNRLRSSTTPSAQPRPTTTIHGTPSSSASLNFTPGDALRSSSSTSTPSRSSSAASSLAPARAAVVLVGDHDVDVERRHRRRPTQPDLVVVLLGDHRDQPGHPDAVGAHGQPDAACRPRRGRRR